MRPRPIDRSLTLRALPVALSLLWGWPGRVESQESRMYAPEVAVQSADYAQARRRFRTNLVRRGPSPQMELALRPPPGVVEVEFPSGPLRLKAWMSEPPRGGPKLPAVLFLHGGFAFGFADWEMALPYWEAGYLVMVPMLRGENGQRGTFTMFYDEVDDVLAAADFLRKQPSVDPSHIYLAGHSAGATLALLAAEASPQFRAVASFDAAPDQQLLYKGSASRPGPHREIVFDLTDPRELQMRSPLAFARSLRSPTRLYYSTEAASIVRLPNEHFVKVAKARGRDVAAVQVAGSHMSHVAPAMQQSIAFFARTLGAPAARRLTRRPHPELVPSLEGNTTFRLKGHPAARVVMVAGSFNGWYSRQLLCGRENGDWVCRIDLPPGRYLYQFVVDDEWILDPDNPLQEDSGNGGVASVLVK